MTEDTSSLEARSDATPDVVVLGAGFSKAVFADLPTTDQLGEAVRCRLSPTDQAKLPATEFEDGRFEGGLSYLAEEQPHLAEDQGLEARALLHRVTAAVRVVLAEMQARALVNRAPPWLYELLSVLHVRQATVLSLNYDNLIECCVEESFLKAARGTVSVTEEDVLGGLPPCADFPGSSRNVVYQGIYDGGQIATWRHKAETFRLFKLHGSLSWYWVPGDTIGATLQRWLLPGTFGDPREVEDETRERVLPSREAYIVPPSALKSRHFQNPISRQLWRWASEALSSTTRVVLIGYSAPAGDRTFSGMLTDSVRGRQVAVEVVNPDADRVAARLVRIGVPADSITKICSDNCVAVWTKSEIEQMADSVVGRLAVCELTGKELLYVTTRSPVGVVSVAASKGSNVLLLQTDPPGTPVVRSTDSESLLSLIGSDSRIVVDVQGTRLPIVDFEVVRQPNAGSLDQLLLVSAGQP